MGSIDNSGLSGLCEAAILTLKEGFCVGALVSLILNAILPSDDEDDVEIEMSQHWDSQHFSERSATIKKLISERKIIDPEYPAPPSVRDEESQHMGSIKSFKIAPLD